MQHQEFGHQRLIQSVSFWQQVITDKILVILMARMELLVLF